MLNFFNFDLLTTVKLWLTNMCNHAKFHQNHANCYADIVIFLIFEMAGVCNLWFWKFWNLWSLIIFGRRICIALPNIIKMGQTLARISHLTFFLIAAVWRNSLFKNLTFEQGISRFDNTKVWIYHAFGIKTLIRIFLLFWDKQ